MTLGKSGLLMAACLLAVHPVSARDPFEAMLAGESAMQGKKLQKAIKAAAKHPFGSAKNPVRADMLQGQRAYLSRLRCSDGNAPNFSRGGSVGDSPYKNIMDVYNVDCGNATPGQAEIYMDMYHNGHIEKAAVAGFTIVD